MPQEDYDGKQQPKDGDDNKFVGLYVLNGSDEGIFVAPSGANLRQEDDNNVADTRVQVGGEEGLGYAIGTREDEAADDDDGTWSQMSLFKRFMLRSAIASTAWGALGDAAATSDGTSTAMSFIRGIVVLIADRLPAGGNTAHDAADAGNPLKIGGKASDVTPTPVSIGDRVNAYFDIYGQLHTADDTLADVLGQTSDLALAADQSGTLNAHARTLTLQIGDRDDAAVITDANGSLSAKARGLVVQFASLLTRWPAALTGAGSLKTALMEAIPAGTNNIGDVDVLTLPALPAGSNNIGDVDVLSLPALAAGTNNIGQVDQARTPGVFPILERKIVLTGTTSFGDAVPVPPGTTYMTLKAITTDAYVNFYGACVSAATGDLLTAGVAEGFAVSPKEPLLPRLFGTAGSIVWVKCWNDPNVSRKIAAFQRFSNWAGFSLITGGIAGRTTEIGGKTITIEGPANWSVSNTSTGIINSVAPDAADPANFLVMDGDVWTGWHELETVLVAGADAELIWGYGDANNHVGVTIYESSTPTDGDSMKLFKMVAGVKTVVATFSAASLAAKGITFPASTPISIWVYAAQVSTIWRAYPTVNGILAGNPPNMGSENQSYHKTAFHTTGLSRCALLKQVYP